MAQQSRQNSKTAGDDARQSLGHTTDPNLRAYMEYMEGSGRSLGLYELGELLRHHDSEWEACEELFERSWWNRTVSNYRKFLYILRSVSRVIFQRRDSRLTKQALQLLSSRTTLP
jgi:hypothetical protein